MADFSALTAEIESNGDAVDSAVVLLTSLADQLANGDISQEAVDAFVADLRANTQALAEAVVANTPVAPEPPA